MIQTIKIVLIDEDGNKLELPEKMGNGVRSKVELKIAELFTEINVRINNLADEEIQIAEKFIFALELSKYLSEFRRTYETQELTNGDK